MKIKTTKVFGKKMYQLFDFAFTKKEANNEAREQKRHGFFVRVEKSGTGYILWLRKRK